MKRYLHIFLMIGMLVASVGCGQRVKVLKPEKMKEIYVDMFVADGWLRERQDLRIKADTSLFFDPIFEKHNCTHEEFFVSWEYYTAHPDEFSDLMTEVVDEIQKRADIVSDFLKQYEEAMAVYASLPDYATVDFKADSMKSLGSIAFWRPDSLCQLDSLTITDSLAVKDSLALGDSLSMKDSIDVLSEGRMLRIDSTMLDLNSRRKEPAEKLDVILK